MSILDAWQVFTKLSDVFGNTCQVFADTSQVLANTWQVFANTTPHGFNEALEGGEIGYAILEEAAKAIAENTF